MSLKLDFLLLVRRFLNDDPWFSSSTITAIITNDEYPQVKFEITDCSKSIFLDFDLYDEEARARALHKAEVLKDVTAQFYETLQVAIDKTVTNQAAKAEADKKKACDCSLHKEDSVHAG